MRLPERIAIAFALLPAALAAAADGGAPRIASPGAQITYKAAKIVVDYRAQQAVMSEVSMSQGDLTVTADRAEAMGLKFDKSRWTFTGNVRISAGQRGELESDSATVEIRDNRIQSALATGHPARFEQTVSTTGVLAQGHADSIEYVFDTSTVRLAGDAWLEYGDNQITGPELVYDIREQKLQGASEAGPSERVHITIAPKKHKGAAAGKPDATGRHP